MPKKESPMSNIEELAKKYFEATGESPEYSFWGWLDAVEAQPNEEYLATMLKEWDTYFEKDTNAQENPDNK